MQKQNRWNQLRCEGISAETAFEELCAQISRCKAPPGGVAFVRNGTPDGGVEFYWICESNKVIGWQCKFYRGALTAQQWNDLDESFCNALINYPELTHYVVSMPQDLPQGRGNGRKTARDRWNARVTKWSQWAVDQGRKIKIEYFGDSEIFHFLDREDQAGRRWYWFEETALTQEWFDRRLSAALANAGPRYSPKLNIEVPLRRTLEFLGRTEEYRKIVRQQRQMIRKRTQWFLLESRKPAINDQLWNTLSEGFDELERRLTNACSRELPSVDWKEIDRHCSSLVSILRDLSYEVRSKAIEERLDVEELRRLHETHEGIFSDASRIISALYDLGNEFEDVSAEVGETKALLITGEAGSGKTHILCDLAKDRIEAGLPTVILFGEHFQDAEPWTQICQQLQLGNIGSDKLLQSLEAAAQAKQERALLIIDGLNESPGKNFWIKYLPGMLATMAPYKWICFAISLRSGFERYLEPKGNIENLPITIKHHHGFAEADFDAIPEFCKFYDLNIPSVPLLLPEFQNPLFLKLTCEALKTTGQHDLPFGMFGIKATFENFVSAINLRLATKLGYDPNQNLVQKSLHHLCEHLATNRTALIPYETAKSIVDSMHNAARFDESLFHHLFLEGVIAQTLWWTKEDDRALFVRCAYERFSDHLIAEYMLNETSVEELKACFRTGGKFSHVVANPFNNQGFLEALSIQVPERFGRELYEFLPPSREQVHIAKVIISGLAWRDPKSITNEARVGYLSLADKDYSVKSSLLNVLVSLAPLLDHPLNADFLDSILSTRTMPERDSYWSIFASSDDRYGDDYAIRRMLNWIRIYPSNALSQESARLYSISLAWMLSTPNRIHRDKATKSLVKLLDRRPLLLLELFQKFSTVDDPYIAERIYAVAYGCALRSDNLGDFSELAKNVYEIQFENESPTKNILIRDHARGLLEICAAAKAIPDDWYSKAKAPYLEQDLPAFPTQEEVDKYKTHEHHEHKSTLANVYYTVMGDNDFVRDVLRSNLSGRWLTRSSRKERAEKKSNRWDRPGQIDWRGPQRWILERVISLGWSEDRFGYFDHAQHRRRENSRFDHKFEEFDHKYTWIALLEILARMQDGADFNDDVFDEGSMPYRGPWQLSYVRNIDVSRLDFVGEPPDIAKSLIPDLEYDSWHSPRSKAGWVNKIDDLPNPLRLINLNDWFLLEGNLEWEEPTEPGEDKYELERRNIWYYIQSFLVDASQCEQVCEWILKQDVFGSDLPRIPRSHSVFLGEFFRGDAYAYENHGYFHRDGWTRHYGDKVPAPILGTADGYLNESGVYDYSFEESINLTLPCERLVRDLDLRWDQQGGFIDTNDKLVAVDPAFWNFESRLFIDRQTLENYLRDKRYEIIWVVRGQKRILGEKHEEFSGQLEMKAVCHTISSGVSGTANYLFIDEKRNEKELRSRKL